MFIFFLDPRQLILLLTRDCLLRHGRVKEDIGQNIKTESEIRLSDADPERETVVSSFGGNCSADRFQLSGNLFRTTRLGSFEQRFRRQPRDSVRLGRLREKTATEHSRDGDERQTRIFANEETQAIREREAFNLACIHWLGRAIFVGSL